LDRKELWFTNLQIQILKKARERRIGLRLPDSKKRLSTNTGTRNSTSDKMDFPKTLELNVFSTLTSSID